MSEKKRERQSMCIQIQVRFRGENRKENVIGCNATLAHVCVLNDFRWKLCVQHDALQILVDLMKCTIVHAPFILWFLFDIFIRRTIYMYIHGSDTRLREFYFFISFLFHWFWVLHRNLCRTCTLLWSLAIEKNNWRYLLEFIISWASLLWTHENESDGRLGALV